MTTENQPARMGDDAVALLRCPFCGGDRLKIEAHGYGHFGAMCDASEGGCGAESGHYPTPSAAALAWNTRNTDASPVPDGVSDRSEFCNEHGMFHSVEMRSPDCTFDSDARELSAHGGDGGAAYCPACEGRRTVFTGIDESPTTICERCEGMGTLATQQPASGVICDTCGGEGTIDQTLGGEHFSDPKARCPDCDGHGEYYPRATTPASAAHGGRSRSIRRMNYAAWMEDSRNGSEPTPDWQEGYEQGRYAKAEAEAAHGGSGEGPNVPIGHCTHQTALALLGRAYTAGQANEGYYPIKEALYDACAMGKVLQGESDASCQCGWGDAEHLREECTPPTSASDAEVEAFEKWAQKRHGLSVEKWADTGNYKYGDTRNWWECWQAALATQQPASGEVDPVEVAEAALQRAIDNFTERQHVDPTTGYGEFNNRDEEYWAGLHSALDAVKALNDVPPLRDGAEDMGHE